MATPEEIEELKQKRAEEEAHAGAPRRRSGSESSMDTHTSPGEKAAEATGGGELTPKAPPLKDQPTEEGDDTHADLLSTQLEPPGTLQDRDQAAKGGKDPADCGPSPSRENGGSLRPGT